MFYPYNKKSWSSWFVDKIINKHYSEKMEDIGF